jgi:hypothetical protein
MRDFDGSQVLYRLAFASGMRAAARQGEAVGAGGDMERSARSFDALIEAVVLLQASAEAWINRLYETNGGAAHGDGWRSRWAGIGHIAKALDRPQRSISSGSSDLLDEISVLRNYLMHGDERAKQRLEDWGDGRDLHDILTVEFVTGLFQRAEALWAEARTIAGIQTPSTDRAWVADDEFM